MTDHIEHHSFLDIRNVADFRNVRHITHQAEKMPDPVIVPHDPFSRAFIYGTVINDQGRLRWREL